MTQEQLTKAIEISNIFDQLEEFRLALQSDIVISDVSRQHDSLLPSPLNEELRSLLYDFHREKLIEYTKQFSNL